MGGRSMMASVGVSLSDDTSMAPGDPCSCCVMRRHVSAKWTVELTKRMRRHLDVSSEDLNRGEADI